MKMPLPDKLMLIFIILIFAVSFAGAVVAYIN